ncbi:UNVERIFIED_CONTAM: Serine carboxypeptidase-like 18 [Sesamum radiatum]|uniref:Serine carboxypeptidase-like 18 n=1 Tax=Sesamum radiatum TaxID=300843 RepID=A0AAW2RWT2_SESRA
MINANTTASSQSIVNTLPGYPGTLPFKLETGYIGVGENDEVQLFYYFIQSENDPQRDPLILWLTGGPGCSGFSGLIYEIGPLAFDLEAFDGSLPSLIINPYSWTKIANIIFIDSPVGTGFSYATTPQAYHSNDTKSAQYNYSFLRKGYIVGNAITDSIGGVNERVPFAHGMGLISDEYFELAKSSCNGEHANPDPNNKQCFYALQLVNQCISPINEEHIGEPSCHFMSPRHNVSQPAGKLFLEDPIDLVFLPKNERTFCRYYNYLISYVWANNETVREALHIREDAGHTAPEYKPKECFAMIKRYIGVGENDEVQLFYYFIQSENDPERDPLILWLTGGPGCSGFSGLIYEIGPLAFDLEAFDGSFPSLTINPYSWTKIANIIFIDSPVGTGFSYATTPQAHHSSDTKSAQYNYSFLRKWLLNHPKFIKNSLYVAGDSYGGKMTPMVALEIVKGNEAGLKPRMFLQGYIVGNAITDSIGGVNERVPFAHGMGLISDEHFELAKSSCNGEYANPDPNNKQCLYALRLINECISGINKEHIGEPSCNMVSPRSDISRPGELLLEDPIDLIFLPKHERPFCRRYNYVTSHVWANNETVREALHIREGTITDWERCNGTLPYETDVDSVFKHHKLLSEKGFRALGAGHTAAEYKPEECFAMIKSCKDMVKTKNDNQKKVSQCSTNAPIRILTRARDFYSNTMCHCAGGVDRRSVVDCTVPRTNQLPNVGSSKLESGHEDLQGLMRLLASTRKGGGAKVDVDSEGNLVWRIPAAEGVVATSYGGGVGKIGRIDEDKPCCFMEVDVNKLIYSSSRSGNNNKIITRRNVAF